MQKGLFAIIPILLFSGACPYSADNYPDRMTDTYCKFFYKCCNGSERLLFMGGGLHSSEGECKEELGKAFRMLFEPYAEAVRNGRARWDYDKAESCMKTKEDATKECSAEDFLEADDECTMSDYFIGEVANGDLCYLESECEDEEAICESKGDDPDEDLVTQKGECNAPPGVGDTCSDGDCISDAYCDVDNKCRAKKSDGEDCDSSYECKSGNCHYDSVTYDLQCAPKKSNGEVCYGRSECKSDYCDYDTDTCAGQDDDDTKYDICEGNPDYGIAGTGVGAAISYDSMNP